MGIYASMQRALDNVFSRRRAEGYPQIGAMLCSPRPQAGEGPGGEAGISDRMRSSCVAAQACKPVRALQGRVFAKPPSLTITLIPKPSPARGRREPSAPANL